MLCLNFFLLEERHPALSKQVSNIFMVIKSRKAIHLNAKSHHTKVQRKINLSDHTITAQGYLWVK